MVEIGRTEGIPPIRKIREVLPIQRDRRHRPPHIPEEKSTPPPQDDSGGQTPVEPGIGRIVDIKA